MPSNSLNSAQGVKEAGGDGRWSGAPVVSCSGHVLQVFCAPVSEDVELGVPEKEGDNREGR